MSHISCYEENTLKFIFSELLRWNSLDHNVLNKIPYDNPFFLKDLAKLLSPIDYLPTFLSDFIDIDLRN